ncbi:MAG: hypothetical protein P8Y71_08190 [Pseudolabrys sp.]
MELTLAACASTPFAAQNKGMTGRWTLDAPHAPSCRMAFDGNSGANEGTILPDGGCPGDMFMSRRWALAKGSSRSRTSGTGHWRRSSAPAVASKVNRLPACR